MSESPLPPQALLMLAVASRQTGDSEKCNLALDRLLKVQPQAVRALLMKGDLAAEASDGRAAIAFYTHASADGRQQNLPSDLKEHLRSGSAHLGRLAP